MNEPRTLTEAIQRIRDRLSVLDWAHVIYNRVAIHDVKPIGSDKSVLVPRAYVGNGEYADARPNDNYKSIVFFATQAPEKPDYNALAPTKFARDHIVRATRPVVLYGWANLEKLPNYDDGTGFSELIKLNLNQALKSVPCVVSLDSFIDGQLSEVFKPFTISDLDTKYDRWPFVCFRVEITIHTVQTRRA